MSEPALRGRARRILIVDDEPEVPTATAEGFRVGGVKVKGDPVGRRMGLIKRDKTLVRSKDRRDLLRGKRI